MLNELQVKNKIIENPQNYLSRYYLYDYEYPVFGLSKHSIGRIDLIIIRQELFYLIEIKIPIKSLKENGFKPIFDSLKILAYRELFLFDTNKRRQQVKPVVMLPAEYLISTSKHFLRKLHIKFIPIYFTATDNFKLDFDELTKKIIPGWKELNIKL